MALSDPAGSSAKVKNDDIFGGAMVQLNRGSLPSSSINKGGLTASAYVAIGFHYYFVVKKDLKTRKDDIYISSWFTPLFELAAPHA